MSFVPHPHHLQRNLASGTTLQGLYATSCFAGVIIRDPGPRQWDGLSQWGSGLPEQVLVSVPLCSHRTLTRLSDFLMTSGAVQRLATSDGISSSF